jgi:Skp family chaperone for outer membrane proteins
MIDIQNRFFAGQQKLRSEMMRSQQELQALEGRLLKTTTDDINNRIAKFADANGYDMIIDGSAVRFSKKSFDVTDSILKEMGVDPAKAKKIDESK